MILEHLPQSERQWAKRLFSTAKGHDSTLRQAKAIVSWAAIQSNALAMSQKQLLPVVPVTNSEVAIDRHCLFAPVRCPDVHRPDRLRGRRSRPMRTATTVHLHGVHQSAMAVGQCAALERALRVWLTYDRKARPPPVLPESAASCPLCEGCENL